MSDTVETWKKRVASWRASGETAEEFSEGRPWSPKTTLDGWTAEQAWRARKPLDVNRRELTTEVERRTSGLVTSGIESLRARRIAIESALTQRELLSVNLGGRC